MRHPAKDLVSKPRETLALNFLDIAQHNVDAILWLVASRKRLYIFPL
jgi:hypothetical protein